MMIQWYTICWHTQTYPIAGDYYSCSLLFTLPYVYWKEGRRKAGGELQGEEGKEGKFSDLILLTLFPVDWQAFFWPIVPPVHAPNCNSIIGLPSTELPVGHGIVIVIILQLYLWKPFIILEGPDDMYCVLLMTITQLFIVMVGRMMACVCVYAQWPQCVPDTWTRWQEDDDLDSIIDEWTSIIGYY